MRDDDSFSVFPVPLLFSLVPLFPPLPKIYS